MVTAAVVIVMVVHVVTALQVPVVTVVVRRRRRGQRRRRRLFVGGGCGCRSCGRRRPLARDRGGCCYSRGRGHCALVAPRQYGGHRKVRGARPQSKVLFHRRHHIIPKRPNAMSATVLLSSYSLPSIPQSRYSIVAEPNCDYDKRVWTRATSTTTMAERVYLSTRRREWSWNNTVGKLPYHIIALSLSCTRINVVVVISSKSSFLQYTYLIFIIKNIYDIIDRNETCIMYWLSSQASTNYRGMSLAKCFQQIIQLLW